MKKVKLIVLIAFLISSSFNLQVSSAAEGEVKYLGEFCLSLGGFSSDATLKLGVLSFGDDHFPVHGKLLVGSNPAVPVHGTVLVQEAILTATLSGADVDTLSSTYRISIPKSGGSGLFTAIIHRPFVGIVPPTEGQPEYYVETFAAGAGLLDNCP
jgi:hypothetical protein